MAADQKNARARHARVIFADESGLLMAPLVRRTWAPRGRRPVLRQRGRHREKVSIAGGLWWDPGPPERFGLTFRTVVDGYFDSRRSAAFLAALVRQAPGPVVVVWDGGGMHKGDPIRAAVEQFRPRLRLERLPPYAPMLNPIEPLWSWLKYSRLCNAAPSDAAELNRAITRELGRVRRDQGFLRSMWQGSDLPLPRALLM